MFVDVAKTCDIAPGGKKAVAVGSGEALVCNYQGRFYAVACKCGHMNANLSVGTLDGWILTCPAHFAQFDIRTGEVLSGPVPPDAAHGTNGLAVFPVKIEAGAVWVDI